MCTHIYTPVTVIIREEEAIDLRLGEDKMNWREGNWRGCGEGRKGKGKMMTIVFEF